MVSQMTFRLFLPLYGYKGAPRIMARTFGHGSNNIDFGAIGQSGYDDFTYMAWVKINNLPTGSDVDFMFGLTDVGETLRYTAAHALYASSSRIQTFAIDTGNVDDWSSYNPLSILTEDVWENHMHIHDKDTTPRTEFYLNGVSQTALTDDRTDFTTTIRTGGEVVMGVDQGSTGRTYDGDMAYYVFWGGVKLSQARITAIAEGVNPIAINPDDQLSLIPLDGDGGEHDYITGNVGTITGTSKAITNPRMELVENYL